MTSTSIFPNAFDFLFFKIKHRGLLTKPVKILLMGSERSIIIDVRCNIVGK